MEKNVTVDECAEMCDAEKLCNAFEYDVGSRKCKINHDPNPNRKKFFQFFFCQKEGEILFYILYYIQRGIFVVSAFA